ncbi:MAG: class I SAM-dependent methyltransferase [Edaphobacter sp.]
MASEKQPTGHNNGVLWGEHSLDWANIQEGQCRRVYETVFDRAKITSGTSYLDAGCGAGMAAMIAAARGATVSGLDASEALLQIARTRTPSADLRQGELEALPFADSIFDLITGFNSFQYAANPVKALQQAKRVATPGATVVLVTWGEPVGMPAAQLVAALKPLLPPPPPDAPGPFALSNETALKALAYSAGLEPREIVDVECPWEYADLTLALRGLSSAGVAAKARAHSSQDAIDEAHEKALRTFKRSDGSYHIDASFRCLFATA